MRKAHHLAIRCDSDLLRVLGDIAMATGEPVSAVVRDAIRAYCDTKPKPHASEAVALVGALVEAIGSDAVRDRFLAGLKAADELNMRIGNKPSPAVALVTAALQRKAICRGASGPLAARTHSAHQFPLRSEPAVLDALGGPA